MNEDIKDLILGVFEKSLDAQLRAVRRLRQGEPSTPVARQRRSVASGHGIRHT